MSIVESLVWIFGLIWDQAEEKFAVIFLFVLCSHTSIDLFSSLFFTVFVYVFFLLQKKKQVEEVTSSKLLPITMVVPTVSLLP